jgi:hypothetical protein
MLRVIACKRVPSPPARMTAHRSTRRKPLADLQIEGSRENRFWGEFALMIIGFLNLDSRTIMSRIER